MAVLRSGKKTKCADVLKKTTRKKSIKHNFKLKDLTVKIKRLSPSEIESLLGTPTKKYNLRAKKSHVIQRNVNKVVVNSKQMVRVSTSNTIWCTLTTRINEPLYPTEIVLAKMNKYRPWPARINSIYKVGNVVKCYVLFFGTMQIGSVLKSECIKISECDQYLFHAIEEIKAKYNWNLNYEVLSKSKDVERAIVLVKLTQVQKFLLAVRDMECLKKIPYNLSMVRGQVM